MFNKNYKTLVNTVKINLNLINLWFECNGLKINVDKTNIMIFSKSKQVHEFIKADITINNIQIQIVKQTKYLGIWINDNFSWVTHIDYIYSKLVKFTPLFIPLFYSWRKQLLPETLKFIYFTCISYIKLLY